MTRRSFLKSLGLLFFLPAKLGAGLLRGTPIREVIKRPLWVYYQSETGELTPIVGSGVYFLDYDYRRSSDANS